MISQRRYDIDWLRVIAIGLLLIYHIAISFQPWGVFIGFIQNNETNTAIWIPMSMLNIWRIPLLFFVSGMGVWFAIQRRDWKALISERAKRILLPFLFGMAAIVPLHIFVWQTYYHQDLKFIFNPAHLWFLGNLFIYVILLLPVFFYLKNNGNGIMIRFLKRIMSNPIGLLIIMIPFIIEAEVAKPENYELYAMTGHGFALGMIAFFTGFCCVYSGTGFWDTVVKYRWSLLVLSLSMYLIRTIQFDLRTPDYLMAIESNMWIFTVFGFGHKYLNKPSNTLKYISNAVYPIYIIHMVFLFIGSAILFPMELHALLKFVILNIFTLTSCLVCYEFLIRRTNFLRPLFGLKFNSKEMVREIAKPKLESANQI